MASLDEFFAKKDKNKRGKKNKLTPEELAKQLENRGSGYHRKKDHDDYGHRGSDLISNSKMFQDQDDEEWKEFDDNREKDYRGLKIVSLNMKDKEEEMLEKQRAQERVNNEKSSDDSGPWNKRAASPGPIVEEPKQEVKPKVEKEESSKVEQGPPGGGGGGFGSGSRYVPPALRNAPSGDNNIRPTTMAAAVRRLPKGSLPKMDDAQDFPSLSIGDP